MDWESFLDWKSLLEDMRWMIWGVLMALAMGWMSRSRTRSRPADQARTMKYPYTILIVGLVGTAFCIGIEVLSIVYDNGTTNIFTHAIFLSGTGLSLWLLFQYFVERHHLSDEAITYRRAMGSTGAIKWVDIASVRYAPGMKWFKLKSSTGDVVRISAMLFGLPEFAKLVLTHVTASAIDPATAKILEETAAGSPPAVW